MQVIREAMARVIRDVAELPDRTSPDDAPDMMLVTAEELSMILEDAALSTRAVSHPPLSAIERALEPFAHPLWSKPSHSQEADDDIRWSRPTIVASCRSATSAALPPPSPLSAKC